MSAKNVDRHNRFRSITVGFRVSPEENEQLNRAVALSGLPKQEYCYRKCMNRDITVTPNPRIFKMMNIHMKDILMELQRLSQGEMANYWITFFEWKQYGDNTRDDAIWAVRKYDRMHMSLPFSGFPQTLFQLLV